MDVDYGKYFPISDYYEKVLMPLNSKFRVRKNDKFVCCLHDDNDPSLGVIYSKNKGERFHCFGCNAWGNVITLHKRVSLKYFGKNIDDDLARKELCDLFGVDLMKLPSEDDINGFEGIEDKDIRKELAVKNALNRFDIYDFKDKIVEGKINGKGIAYFNTLLVMMINESKDER